MRATAFVVGLVTAAALVAGCAGEAEPADAADDGVGEAITVEHYYATMRDLPGFGDLTDGQLDELARDICELIDDAVAIGDSNMEAVDRIYSVFVESGTSEPDALIATASLVGANCPLDISQ